MSTFNRSIRAIYIYNAKTKQIETILWSKDKEMPYKIIEDSNGALIKEFYTLDSLLSDVQLPN